MILGIRILEQAKLLILIEVRVVPGKEVESQRRLEVD